MSLPLHAVTAKRGINFSRPLSFKLSKESDMANKTTQPSSKERSPMTTRRLTIIEMVILVIATVILFMALLTYSANAQELASNTGSATTQSHKQEKNSQGSKSASDNSTMTKADILKERGVPGKGIDHAPGLQKPFNTKSNAADNAGKKNGNPTSDNRTPPHPTSDNKTVTWSGMPKPSGAPELQKPFYPDSDRDAGINKFLYRWQHRFQEMIQKYFKGANR